MLTRTAGSTHSKKNGCTTSAPVMWLTRKCTLTRMAGSTHSKKRGRATGAPVMWLTKKRVYKNGSRLYRVSKADLMIA